MAQKIWGPSYQEPTLFNSGMFKGAIVGHILAIGTAMATALVFAPAVPIVSAITVLGSALIGGSKRKEEIELENKNGKPVSEPSMFNEGFFSGLNKGMFATKLISTALIIAAAFGAPITPAIGGAVVLGGIAVSTVAGLFSASSGKDRQQQEYAAAVEMQKGEGKGRAPERAQTVEMDEPAQSRFRDAENARRAGHSGHER